MNEFSEKFRRKQKLIALYYVNRFDTVNKNKLTQLKFFSCHSIQMLSKYTKTSYIWFFGEKTWTSVLIYIN